MPDSEREVTQAEIERIYREYEFCGWTETSVKNGVMVNESLRSVSTDTSI
jgi:Ras-related protein Rab-7L1